MTITAKLNYLRIAPRKVRLMADAIRGKSAKEAQAILSFAVKKSTKPLLKLLNQAVNSARNSFQMEADNLYISKITVDEGPKLKRWRPRARGQAYEIQKKTSHITLVLDEAQKDQAFKALSTQASAQRRRVEEKNLFSRSSSSIRTRNEVSSTTKIAGQAEKKPKSVKRVEKKEKKKIQKTEKPRLRPEIETVKPKIEKGIKRIFRRKAF